MASEHAVSERGLAVLHAIVGDYVASNEPVGSKAIVDRHHFGVSAATIRNDMAMLEEEELIVAPHTSSGRVPTDKGYRLYVDTLAKIRPLTSAQRAAIERFLGESTDLEDALAGDLHGDLAAVLELNAGEAARIGATPGDFVEYDLRDLQGGAE